MVGDEELMVRTGDGDFGAVGRRSYHGEMERWCLSFLLLCAADFSICAGLMTVRCFKKKVTHDCNSGIEVCMQTHNTPLF